MADAGPNSGLPRDVRETQALLAEGHYVAGRDLATVVFLSLRMRRPLLLEGEAGVGKTEIAKVLAAALDRDLIRLQCYEGLDLASAAYEWNYPRQMVAIRLAEALGTSTGGETLGETLGTSTGALGTSTASGGASGTSTASGGASGRGASGTSTASGGASGTSTDIGNRLYSREFLIDRPLLRALEPHPKGPPVLLIDEIDRADEPFEAFLLELLSDFQISIPELGTVRAEDPPIVVVTSNRTREVHDALRRRCLYHWVDYPDFETESRIVQLKAPGVAESLRRELVGFVSRLRERNLFKRPGVAETIDWAHALAQLDAVLLTPEIANDTLGLLLKYQDDIARVQGSEAARILEEVQTELRNATA